MADAATHKFNRNVAPEGRKAFFVFQARNEPSLYGFCTSDEAGQYADVLNEGRKDCPYRELLVFADEAEIKALAGRDDLVDVSQKVAEWNAYWDANETSKD
jgi:hypothetical protein